MKTTTAMFRVFLFLFSLSLNLLASIASTVPPQPRNSCSTLTTCRQCLAARCTWTEAFDVPSDPQVSRASNGPGNKCVEYCEQVGTSANCFLADNYIGLTSQEICAIADRTLPPVVSATENGADVAVEENTITHSPSSRPTLPPSNSIRASAPPTSPPAAVNAASEGDSISVTQIPSVLDDLFSDDDSEDDSNDDPNTTSQIETPISSTQDNAANNDSNWANHGYSNDDGARWTVNVTNESQAPFPSGDQAVLEAQEKPHNDANANAPGISCAGFIACEQCSEEELACAYVAWNCAAFCPELSHVPCYQVEGNYSEMTAAALCKASSGKDESGGSLGVLRSIPQPNSGGEIRFGTVGFAVAWLMIAATLVAS